MCEQGSSDFQLTYSRKEWVAERASWRSVILLNLLRNVNDIVSMMSSEMAQQEQQSQAFALPSSTTNRPSTASSVLSEESFDAAASVSSNERRKAPGPLKFRDRHQDLQHRLSSLRTLQVDLERRLGAATTEPASTDSSNAAPFPTKLSSRPHTHHGTSTQGEFSVNSRGGWKSVLRAVTRTHGGNVEALKVIQEQDNEIASAIGELKEDIKTLWDDPIVQDMLSRRKSRVEDSPGL